MSLLVTLIFHDFKFSSSIELVVLYHSSKSATFGLGMDFKSRYVLNRCLVNLGIRCKVYC